MEENKPVVKKVISTHGVKGRVQQQLSVSAKHFGSDEDVTVNKIKVLRKQKANKSRYKTTRR